MFGGLLAFEVCARPFRSVPPEGLERVDIAVEIPMIGTGASLNVAVPGSLVLYRLAGLA